MSSHHHRSKRYVQMTGASSRHKTLRDVDVSADQRWIYSAGFNVSPDLTNTERIDEELSDLEYLISNDCKVALIAHQGSGPKNGSVELQFVRPYLQEKLGVPVHYTSIDSSNDGHSLSQELKNGEVTLFGNTRLIEGETNNCPSTARLFADLGDYVAIGGFCKIHRRHASNCGVLDYVPGVLTTGITNELDRLSAWNSIDSQGMAVAMLGGTKKEKFTMGLPGLVNNCDAVILGGAVLNAFLLWRGSEIGSSVLPESFEDLTAVNQFLFKHISSSNLSKYILPEAVLVESVDGRLSRHSCDDLQLQGDQRIVDFELSERALDLLAATISSNGRLLLAGPPCDAKNGFKTASTPFLDAMRKLPDSSLLMGGDSAIELPFDGEISTGGGASLAVLVEAELPVLESMDVNQKLWK